MILLIYVTKKLEKAQLLELTAFIAPAIYTFIWLCSYALNWAAHMLLWRFFWHLGTDTSLFLLSLCWRLYD